MIFKFIENKINGHCDGALFLTNSKFAGVKSNNALSFFCGVKGVFVLNSNLEIVASTLF
jgi:hypothetical protein